LLRPSPVPKGVITHRGRIRGINASLGWRSSRRGFKECRIRQGEPILQNEKPAFLALIIMAHANV
jgi:hypothetical protein